jgi:hypothetical protein
MFIYIYNFFEDSKDYYKTLVCLNDVRKTNKNDCSGFFDKYNMDLYKHGQSICNNIKYNML